MGEGYIEKALQTGISLYRAPKRNLEAGSFTRDFERGMKGALEALKELCEVILERGLLYWGPWRICIKGSGDRHLSP